MHANRVYFQFTAERLMDTPLSMTTTSTSAISTLIQPKRGFFISVIYLVLKLSILRFSRSPSTQSAARCPDRGTSTYDGRHWGRGGYSKSSVVRSSSNYQPWCSPTSVSGFLHFPILSRMHVHEEIRASLGNVAGRQVQPYSGAEVERESH